MKPTSVASRLVTDLDSSLTKVKLDQDSMYDALLNLATNGIDAIADRHYCRLLIPHRTNPRTE